jgi:hypothetical protein
MKHGIVAVLTAAAMCAGIWPAISAENSIVGTWLLTSFSLMVLDTKETSHPWGPPDRIYPIFSRRAHGHVSYRRRLKAARVRKLH